MKVSTRGEYGVRAMVSLAHHFGGGPMSIAEIARQSNIPPAYLEQLIAPLRRADLVVSKRGARGGYVLSRDPSLIRFGDVYRVMEGPISPMECVSEDIEDQTCPLIENCETRPMWIKLRDAMTDALDSTTLADLARKPESGPISERGEYVTPVEEPHR